jgi:ABC-2 type transport system ATP-binding protein
VIRVEALSKSYGTVKALDAISLDVNQGEILGLLGPNGAGKTTTLKILSGYLRPDAGRVDIKGLNGVEQTEQTRALLGYLPEYNPLYQDLLVYDYLHYIAAMRGIPLAARDQRVAEMVELCGLASAVAFKVGELSKGNRQRVGLAQAMIHDPEILILDEPTAGLDPNQISEIRDLIRQLGRKKTVILSSHILSEVEATCDRVVIIHHGKVVADGSTRLLQSQAAGDAKVTVKLAQGKPREVLAALKALPGVVSAERGEDEGAEIQGYALQCDRGADLRPEVFRMAAKEGWVLYELRREAVSLEDVFKQLTAE